MGFGGKDGGGRVRPVGRVSAVRTGLRRVNVCPASRGRGEQGEEGPPAACDLAAPQLSSRVQQGRVLWPSPEVATADLGPARAHGAPSERTALLAQHLQPFRPLTHCSQTPCSFHQPAAPCVCLLPFPNAPPSAVNNDARWPAGRGAAFRCDHARLHATLGDDDPAAACHGLIQQVDSCSPPSGRRFPFAVCTMRLADPSGSPSLCRRFCRRGTPEEPTYA